MAPNRFLVVRDAAPDDALSGAVIAMGNFDGVHRGHQAVIAIARDRAKGLSKPAAVLTFEPHPRAFFSPDEPLFRLTDEASKLRLLASTGLDGAIVLTFDAALANLTAEDFVARILVGRFAISGAVIGFNFHFGKNRAGSPDFLAAEGRKRGFAVDVVPPFELNGRPVSSGPIRDALGAGRLDAAAALLGFPWFVSGEVIHGDKRGRELGFPTANLRLDAACGLRHGVYAVRTPSADAATTGWLISAGGRCSIPARCCSKSFCLIFPATSTARASMSPSSNGSVLRRYSARSTNSCAG